MKAATFSTRSFPRVYYELLFVGFIIMMGMSMPSSFLPILASNLDPSGLMVGLVVSAWFFSRIFLELPAGIFSDRLGRRRLLVLGIGLSVIGPLLCSLADNIYLLILGRGVWGMGTAFYFMNNMAILIDLFPSRFRGRALGIFQGIEFVGSFIGAPIGAYLTVYMSYGQVFYFTLALTAISLLITISSGRIKGIDIPRATMPKPSLKEIFLSFGERGIAIVCLCNFFRMFIRQGIFQTIFQLYLNKHLMFSVEHIGIIISLSILGHVISVLISGVLSDRFGRRPVLVAGYAVCATTLYAITEIETFELMLLAGFFSGLGEGFSMATLIALLSDVAPSSIRGGTIGLYRTFQDIGGFSGPISFMLVYTTFGIFLPFYLAMLFDIMNLVVIATFRIKPHPETY